MEAGDVLLVEGIGKISRSLVLAQKLIYKDTKSSHVALSLGDGCFIHATSDGGVHLTFIKDELNTCKEDWKVIRNVNLSESEKEKITKAGLHFIRQGYNKKFMGNGTEHSSFCSELVAKAYRKANVPLISPTIPSKVSPAHFDQLADRDNEWENVTDEYIELLKKINKNEFAHRFVFQTVQLSIQKRAVCHKVREGVFESMLAIGNEEQKKTVKKVKTFYKENRNLTFWDED